MRIRGRGRRGWGLLLLPVAVALALSVVALDGKASAEQWRSTLVGAPLVRAYHTAVWTGTEMIVWGGDTGTAYLNTGGRYTP